MLGSYLSDSYFIENTYNKIRKRKEYKASFDLDKLFKNNEESFYISGQDKIYKLTNKGIYLVTFTQSKVDKEEAFSESVIVSHTSIDIDNIVSASVELFGLVI